MHANTGERGSADGDVVAFLLECHANGRNRVGDALRLLRDGGGVELVRRTAAATHEYLTIANPLHELDEEQLVAPALRTYAPAQEADALVAPLVRDHVRFDRMREELAARWAIVADDPTRFDAVRAELESAMRKFAAAIEAHVAIEEQTLFPRLRAIVPKPAQRQMLDVMRARRARNEPPVPR
jgi:iron-sulfur cluster repair protein YtfE (RIC family)